MPDFRPVFPGEPFKPGAAEWNAFKAAAKAYQEQQLSQAGGQPSKFDHTDIIRVINDTETDLLRFSVVGLDRPIFTPDDSLDAFLQGVTFRGVVPTSDHYGRFAILLEPALAGRVAKAWLSGVCIVQLDVATPGHIFADIVEGDTSKLQSSGGGAAQILWKESDEAYGGAYDDAYSYGYGDHQWAVVRLGPKSGQPVHFLSPLGGIPARTGAGPWVPGSAECNIMVPTGNGEVDFLGIATIYNDADIAVTGDAEGWAVWGQDGRLYAITEYCPPAYG